MKDRIKYYGQVFTPNNLSIYLIDKLPETVWEDGKVFLDPAAGQGSLLEEVLKKKIALGHKNIHNTVFGIELFEDNCEVAREKLQEIDPTFPDTNIICANTLTLDYPTVDVIVTNYPWSKCNYRLIYKFHQWSLDHADIVATYSKASLVLNLDRVFWIDYYINFKDVDSCIIGFVLNKNNNTIKVRKVVPWTHKELFDEYSKYESDTPRKLLFIRKDKDIPSEPDKWCYMSIFPYKDISLTPILDSFVFPIEQYDTLIKMKKIFINTRSSRFLGKTIEFINIGRYL